MMKFTHNILPYFSEDYNIPVISYHLTASADWYEKMLLKHFYNRKVQHVAKIFYTGDKDGD